MTYVIGDIHGHYEKYIKMLAEIDFSDDDVLYVVGDIIDRGDEGLRILDDMSMRVNVIPIIGNHEIVAITVMRQLQELTEENIKTHIDDALSLDVQIWQQLGGGSTLLEFASLQPDEREYVLEYLMEFSLYRAISVAGKNYILVHSGLPDGAKPGNLDKYDAYDFETARTDYKREYFKDIFLITGHFPTSEIDDAYKGKIYRKHNHIAIDTGAGWGDPLACICLDTDEEFYVQ